MRSRIGYAVRDDRLRSSKLVRSRRILDKGAMALEDDIALLSRIPLFQGMERDALRLLAFSADMRTLRAGDVLFRRGEAADSGFVVVRGAIAMFTNDAGLPTTVAGAGSLIGEIALISQTQRPATAVAREPSSLIRLSRTLFRRTLDEYPHVAQRLQAEMRERILSTSEVLAGVRDRLRSGEA